MANNFNNIIPEHSNSLSNEEVVQNASYADALKQGKPADPSISNNNVNDSNLNNSSVADHPQDSESSEREQNSKTSVDNLQNSSCSILTDDFSSCLGSGNVSEVTLDLDGDITLSSEVTDDPEENPLPSEDTITSSILNDSNRSNRSSSLSSEDDSIEEEEELGDSNSQEELNFPFTLKWGLRSHNPDLPDTVTLLETPHGGKVYLIGTAHFSSDSQEDVSRVIRLTHPDVVMVELCKSRINILSLDEETILEESKNMNLDKIRLAIRQNGFVQGILYLLLLNISAHITKQLGMAPGGEFRRAFAEAKKVPGCTLHLGDRPIHITVQRALAPLSFWKKLRIGWYMITSLGPISKEDVERCKQRDLLEQMLAEMAGEFPELSKVFLQERDTYLTYSLQMACMPMPSNVALSVGAVPTVVVGVVGIGHVPGIVENWGKVKDEDIPTLLSIPEPSRSSRIFPMVMRYSFYGLLIYAGYRMLPKSILEKPTKFITDIINR